MSLTKKQAKYFGGHNKPAGNIGLAKNWLKEVIELLFCYFALVPADGIKI